MDTDPDQHSRMNTVMDTDQCRVAMDTAHHPATTMVTDQCRLAMGTDQDLATVMDTAHHPATTMDTDPDQHSRTNTVMDTDQYRVVMDTDHRPVTDVPLGRQPIRQTVMRLSRRRDRTCPRPLLVNDDRRGCAGAISLLGRAPIHLSDPSPRLRPTSRRWTEHCATLNPSAVSPMSQQES
jgi:hypothetical protein